MLHDDGTLVLERVVVGSLAEEAQDAGLVFAQVVVDHQVWHLDMEQVVVFQHHFLVGQQVVQAGVVLAALHELSPEFLEALLRELFHFAFLEDVDGSHDRCEVERHRCQSACGDARLRFGSRHGG